MHLSQQPVLDQAEAMSQELHLGLQEDTGPQTLEPSFTAFSGTLGRSWIRRRVPGTQTGTPILDAVVGNEHLTHCNLG